jgi:hypothetical protein
VNRSSSTVLYDVHSEPLVLIPFVQTRSDQERILDRVQQLMEGFSTEGLFEKLPRVQDAGYNLGNACLRKTRTMVLNDVDRWVKNTEDDCPRIFWLHGMAGEGKTAIATSISYELDEDKRLGASFFFSRDINEKSRPDKVFSTIVHQLVHHQRHLRKHVIEALETKPDAGCSSTANQFYYLIQKPFRGLKMSSTKPIVIVLDALDECGTEKDRKELLQAFSEFPSVFKLFLSSRPENDIMKSMGPLAQQYNLSRIAKNTVNEDISTFMTNEMMRIEYWPGEEALQALVRQASGLFIWASTAMKFLMDEDVGDPQEQLDMLLDNSSPPHESPSLDRLYSSVLRQAFPAKAPARILTRFREVVGAILAVRDPLPPSTLGQLLFLRDKSEEHACGMVYEAVAKLRSVLSLPDRQREHLDPISIIHPSFAEFLTDSDQSEKPFAINLFSSHIDLMSNCLETLVLPAKGSTICTKALVYARKNWCYHFQYILAHDRGINLFNTTVSGNMMSRLSCLLDTLSSGTPEAIHWLLFMRDVREDLRSLAVNVLVFSPVFHRLTTIVHSAVTQMPR